jgi:hypothetical protein
VHYFHGCYSVGEDELWGVNRHRKGADHTLAALKSIRSARPDGTPIYVILDDLSAHCGKEIRAWAVDQLTQAAMVRAHTKDSVCVVSTSSTRKSAPTLTLPSAAISIPSSDACILAGIASMNESTPNASHGSVRTACRHRTIPDFPELEPPLIMII